MITITETWKENGYTYLYCVGDPIREGFTCERVIAKGKVYAVDAIDVMCSITGNYAAVLRILTDDDIPTGELQMNTSAKDTVFCKCFSPPPNSPFTKGNQYRWEYCIDGKVVYTDAGDTRSFGEFEFYQFFVTVGDIS